MNHEPVKQAVKRRPDWAALVIAAVLVAIAAVIFMDAARLREVTGYSPVGPGTVPMVIAVMLTLLAIWTVFAAFRGDFPERDRQELPPVAWVVGGLVAQMLLLNHLGFSIATGILFAATAAGFGKRRIWISLPIGIVLCLIVWLIFAGLLQLSLPAGPLERLFQ
ncbi:tripartite tricarboxylate transporter TctB family protein [Rhizobium sp. SSA_523]|uniref:tripartite tricarboxylate transporter TctB family protein n=1 Tax=Rhizobium sp. SSA_523 TaxID=2952477 RepID=UPI002090F139|nr:tripartite tricarboxylate transporter TctB family protein [Rhizobium sp. SSA_523]MCO5733799.1 tripartite tricarboxylate transporter TctB family protein [Rhizobium sp. SSA_523]WKC24926.1 tripartite tricarboxylate transporter TctB family protein [Rhizobium sp. SSA_523]